MTDPSAFAKASAAAATTATTDAKKKPRINPWVDNIESLITAVVLALIIRVFVLEAFVIPTGSMAGTLYGDHFNLACENCGYDYALGASRRPDGSIEQPVLARVLCPNCGYTPMRLSGTSGGDRILVNKVLYRFEQPKRWDPFVFVNPTCTRADPKTTYIKRLLGLPGDHLEIMRGDIVVNGKVQRKPAAAQEALWMHVYDSNYLWKTQSAEKPWRFEKGWSQEGTRLVVAAPPGATTRAYYSGRLNTDSGVIRDTYAYDQDVGVRNVPVTRGAGFNVVTDLRLSFDATPKSAGTLEATPRSAGTLVATLAGDDYEDRAVIDLAAGRATIERETGLADHKTVVLGEGPLPAADANASRRVVFSRVDYLVTLVVDGKTVAQKDLWSAEEYAKLNKAGQADSLSGCAKSGVALGARGASLALANVRIERDVYYCPPYQAGADWKQYCERTIAAAEYFAMGDNSPESYDSRYWGVVPAENLIGKALVVWWHPTRVRLIR